MLLLFSPSSTVTNLVMFLASLSVFFHLLLCKFNRESYIEIKI